MKAIVELDFDENDLMDYYSMVTGSGIGTATPEEILQKELNMSPIVDCESVKLIDEDEYEIVKLKE